MSSLAEDVQALVFIALDGVSFAVPVSKIPIELLKKIILGLEAEDMIQFEPSEVQIDQLRSQVTKLETAKDSAVEDLQAHEHDKK